MENEGFLKHFQRFWYVLPIWITALLAFFYIPYFFMYLSSLDDTNLGIWVQAIGVIIAAVGTVGTLIGTIWIATSEKRVKKDEKIKAALFGISVVGSRVDTAKKELERFEKILTNRIDSNRNISDQTFQFMGQELNSLQLWEIEEIRPMWVISDDCASNLAAFLYFLKTIINELNDPDKRQGILYAREKRENPRAFIDQKPDEVKHILFLKFSTAILKEIKRAKDLLQIAQDDYEDFSDKHLGTNMRRFKHSQTPNT